MFNKKTSNIYYMQSDSYKHKYYKYKTKYLDLVKVYKISGGAEQTVSINFVKKFFEEITDPEQRKIVLDPSSKIALFLINYINLFIEFLKNPKANYNTIKSFYNTYYRDKILHEYYKDKHTLLSIPEINKWFMKTYEPQITYTYMESINIFIKSSKKSSKKLFNIFGQYIYKPLPSTSLSSTSLPSTSLSSTSLSSTSLPSTSITEENNFYLLSQIQLQLDYYTFYSSYIYDEMERLKEISTSQNDSIPRMFLQKIKDSELFTQADIIYLQQAALKQQDL